MNLRLRGAYTCYPEGKHKVLTMSYDDGNIEDRRLVEIFNKYGIKGTFHLNSGLESDNLDDPSADHRYLPISEYKELYKGHEVSCHTYHHPMISRTPMEHIADQILEDKKALEAAVGYPIRGMSYPYGALNDEIVNLLPSLGIKYSRTVWSTEEFYPENDFLRWKPTCHHDSDLIKLGRKFLDLPYNLNLWMMYVWGHSYEFRVHDNWDLIEDFCKMMSGQDDIWYATNIEIVEYMEAAKALCFTAIGDKVYNPSATSVWLDINVDGETTLKECKPGIITDLY